ncbi:MAG: hypothetical protein KDM63_19880, partial [Verrucomicrobiae bacterium]|nr:hypothetical protein [Verrucomicrobiae bacterium]
MPTVDTANRFDLPLHFAKLDSTAKELLYQGLGNYAENAAMKDGMGRSYNCLTHWCRISPSELDRRLFNRINDWRQKFPKDNTLVCISELENARRLARAGNSTEALSALQVARKANRKIEPRALTDAWLVEGMLYRMRGDEPRAQRSWAYGLEAAATASRRNPLFLSDLFQLRCLTQSWERDNAHLVLLELMAGNLKEGSRAAFDAVFLKLFHSDPRLVAVLNRFLSDEVGRTISEDYALCRDTPRGLTIRTLKHLIAQFLLSAPELDRHSNEEDRLRIRLLADSL